jgi:ribosomal protein S18 acetylase RimI-like enzyme
MAGVVTGGNLADPPPAGKHRPAGTAPPRPALPRTHRLRQHHAMPQDPRPATRDDLPAVEAIVRAAYARYVPRIGREPGPMLDDYAALIRDGRVHVVGDGGTVQGLLVLLPQADAMLLDNIAVAPAAQGTGLGRRLMRFAERAAAAAGYRTITLYTHEAMTENVALYARAGYRETHRAEEKGYRRIYMAKPLA